MKSLLLIATLALLFSSHLRAESSIHISPTKNHVAFDSVGVERRDGKLFVLHRVNQSQTLYAIARRYNTSVEVIKAANPGMLDAVKYNQVVRVPQPDLQLSRKDEKAVDRAAKRDEKAAKRAAKDNEQLMKKSESVAKPEPAPKAETPPKAAAKKSAKASLSDVHVVEAGQTLYSIAVKNKVSMDDIRRWNNLTGDNILLGQALLISEKGYAARQTGPEPEPAVSPAKPEPKAETTKKEPAKSTPKPDPAFRPDPTAKAESNRSANTETGPVRPGDPGTKLPAKGRRVAEIGMADRIEADESSNKYLALHRSAPVGALVQVRNDISNQSLWVKVIGRLPNTGVNDRVLIKLSAKAFEKLSPNNQSFRAEVSYMVP